MPMRLTGWAPLVWRASCALVDPRGGNPDGPKAVAMLNDNLGKVPSRVLSPAGRALVPERKAELEKFLSDLKRESEDLRTL